MSENEEKTQTEAAEAEAAEAESPETESQIETEATDDQAADDTKAEDKAEEKAEDAVEAQAKDEADDGDTEADKPAEAADDAAEAEAETDEPEETEQEAGGESAGEEQPQAQEAQAGESQAGESQDEESGAENSKAAESKAGDAEVSDSKAGAKDSESDAETDETKAQEKGQKKASKKEEPKKPAEPLSPEIAALDEARKKRQPVSGKVIGWNKGGFHVVLGDVPAFCPKSAITDGEPEEPESYVDKELDFTVLEIRKGGKRIVVSRAGAIRAERSAKRKATMAEVKPGAVLTGTVVSLTDFGAFIDLGGVQGLLHVSEISRSRVEHPSDVFEEGQEVEVKVLKVEKRGKRISLSCKALEPDPWQAIDDFSEGQEVEGTVERAEKFGVLVELAPGLSGLIPSSKLSLPADARPQRVFPRGKEVKVQILSIDKKRKRISLLPEGAQADGSKKDLEEYRKEQGDQKLGAMAAAFEKAQSKNG